MATKEAVGLATAISSRGLGLALDLLSKGSSGNVLHNIISVSTVSVALTAAAAVGPLSLFDLPLYDVDVASGLDIKSWPSTAHCDALVLGATKKRRRATAGTKRDKTDRLEASIRDHDGNKQYQIKKKSMMSVLSPSTLLVSAVRALLINYLPLMEEYLQPEEESLEEDLTLPPNRSPLDLVRPAVRSLWTFLRELSTLTMRRGLEKYVHHSFSDRIAWKLTKDTWESARRKARRALPPHILFVRVTLTSFRGHIISATAQLVVQLNVDVYMAIQSYQKLRHQGVERDPALRRELRRLAGRAAAHSVKSVVGLLAASLGAGIFSLLWAQRATWIGFVLGDLAGPALISPHVENWANR